MTAPGKKADLHFQQTLNSLTDYVNATALQEPLADTKVLRVDTLGSDVTGTAGRDDMPFATITRALAVAQNGDTIKIGAGTFIENVVIPPGLTSINIIGSGMYATIIQPAALIALAYTASSSGAVMNQLTISNLSLIGVTNAINVNGTLKPAGFQGGLILDHVYMQVPGAGLAVVCTVLNNVQMNKCATPILNAVQLATCSSATLRDCQTGQLWFTYLAAAAVKPSLGRRTKSLYSCTFFGFASGGAGNIESIYCDWGCVSTADINFIAFDDASLGNALFEFHGTNRANLLLEHTLSANGTPFVFDRSKLDGTVTVASLGAPAGFIATANFRGAVLGIVGAGTIIAGNNSALDLVGATFDHTAGVLVTAGAGTPGVANRSVHLQATALGVAGTTPIAFAVDFIDANYSVHVETTAAGRDPFVTNKTPAGFDITHAVGADAGANVVVMHQ